MNFHCYSNNSNKEKYLDDLIHKISSYNEYYNSDSLPYEYIAKNKNELKVNAFNNQNILELDSQNLNYQNECTQTSPGKSNDNQLFNYDNQLHNLFNNNINYFISQKRNIKKINKKSNRMHTKFSTDNMQRKCLNMVYSCILQYVNYQIKKNYDGNIGNGIYIKQLLDINKEKRLNFNIIKNLTVKEIFYREISDKYTSFLSNHNKMIINKALNEKEEFKRKRFYKLFNLTFKECIQKFLGNDKSEDSEGFPLFDDIKYKLKETNEYLNRFKECLIKFC